MNDKTIINAISTTYFVIVSFFTFIFLSLSTIFIVLQNGLYLDNISIPNVKIKQLYINWNEKIDIKIEHLSIYNKNSKNAKPFNIKKIKKYIKKISSLNHFIGDIVIDKVVYNTTTASIVYRGANKGTVTITSPTINFDSEIYHDNNNFVMHIKKLKSLNNNINAKGDLYLNLKSIELFSNLHVNINDEIDANLFLKADTKKLVYSLQNNKNIKDIHYLFNTLNLPKEIKFWALDAIDMQYVSIEDAHGFVDFNNPKEAFKNISIKATVNKLNYTYNLKLDSIHTNHTQLDFKNGILYIRPKQAYSYGMFLGKSWLKIDFTKQEELLTLYLLFNAKLNKDMLHILETYKIKLPFLQNSGSVDTNLKLAVGLQTIDIDARGKFHTKQANFNYLGLNIDIFDAYIKLNNYDVKIKNMKAKYKDMLTSNVNVKYNAHTSKGAISFRENSVNLKNYNISLAQKPLNVIYNIAPNSDSISVEQSSWLYKNIPILIDAIHIPFNLQTLSLNLPATYYDIKDISTGFIEGNIDIKDIVANLKVDVLSFDYHNVTLNKSNTQLNIMYNKLLKISAKNKISFNSNNLDIDLANFNATLNTNSIDINNTYLTIDNLLYTKIDASYNTKTDENKINLHNLSIKNNGVSLYKKDDLTLNIQQKKSTKMLKADEIDLKIIKGKNYWEIKANSLEKISKNSKFLRDLNVTNGNVVMKNSDDTDVIKLNANLIYPYKLLSINNEILNTYKIKGAISNSKAHLNINDKVSVEIDKNIDINMSNCSINLHPLLEMLQTIKQPSNSKKESSITLKAHDIDISLGNNRRILAETIDLQYTNKILTAQLKHKNGSAGLKFNNQNFHIYGSNFNDVFMDNLFSLSKYKGGSLDFSITGKITDYSGVFYIKDTTVLDYKVLNNVLATINTIPSLVTFSLPGYNKHGLKVDTSYMKFTVKDGLFNVSDFVIDSKELDIFGKGVANLKKDTIDATVNLRTDLGSNISKIPIVGYIMFNGESISTNLSIKGKLSDPQVKSLLAKDIITAPINILKRTVLFPFKLIESVVGDKNSSK